MKTAILSIGAIAIGIAAGVYCTQAEFRSTDVPLPIRVAQGSASDLLGNRDLESPKAVVVDGERYNFGTVDRNQKLSHEFVLRNEGKAPLSVLRGKTSCTCITSELPDNQLLPGEETRIRLEWSVKGAESPFEQSAQFSTNDPNRPVLHFLIYGSVVDTVRAEPGDLPLGEISASEGRETGVKLYTQRAEQLEIEKVEFSQPELAEYFDVTFQPIPADELPQSPATANGLAMRIVIKPGLQIGPLDQTIQVFTNLQPEPLKISIHGRVTGDIRIAGQGAAVDRLLVALPDISARQGLKHTVFVILKGSHREEAALRIDSTEPATELRATLGEPIHDNSRVVRIPLTLEIPPGTTPVSRVSQGSYAKVHLRSKHPQFQEFTIEVRYLVQD
jgi:hypothetical protein